jgi:hypothetical protein
VPTITSTEKAMKPTRPERDQGHVLEERHRQHVRSAAAELEM